MVYVQCVMYDECTIISVKVTEYVYYARVTVYRGSVCALSLSLSLSLL